MKFFPHVSARHVAALSLVSLSLAMVACKPGDKADAAKTADATTEGKDGALAIPGLATEKEQASYMIGMAMGKQLTPIKDEVDPDVIMKAIKSTLAGEKLLLDEKQAQQIGETFGQKMQAKQIAKMMADAKKNLADGQAFLAANAKKPNVKTTASGLQYEVLTEGKGAKPKPTDAVSAHYKGTLLDGKTFDSSYDRGQPATFQLTQVVPGWQEGIQLMPVGSKYRFWLPASLGYGEKGTQGGPIGPNATLVFEVELLDIVKQ
ncbi:FKBP-type peptidyl-prolyl cis-trans isomerase [Lysobacter koreensis]|uniref:Peptidyl-prolyl cis-trans isomerase n=1 Tax=Lysobacter koreensis TaxID=266122 RepID=A0ABW2YIP8_9GAMM